MKKTKEKQLVTVNTIVILAKLSDGTIRQVHTTKEEDNYVMSLLMQMSSTGRMKILETVFDMMEIEDRK